jgi:hypothetical protein
VAREIVEKLGLDVDREAFIGSLMIEIGTRFPAMESFLRMFQSVWLSSNSFKRLIVNNP